MPIPHIETIIQRTVQEKKKEEIVQKESHFLDYIKTKKDTPSKIYWTKDKSGFFESVLACEANVNEDELLNLIHSSMYCLFCQFPNIGYLWTL